MFKWVFWRVPFSIQFVLKKSETIGIKININKNLVERWRVFHEWVGLLWTEKLAWQMDVVLSVLEGFALKRLSQKLRGEEEQEEASLTVINIIIHTLSSLGQRSLCRSRVTESQHKNNDIYWPLYFYLKKNCSLLLV